MQGREDRCTEWYREHCRPPAVQPSVDEASKDGLLRDWRYHADDDDRQHVVMAVVVLHLLALAVGDARKEALVERLQIAGADQRNVGGNRRNRKPPPLEAAPSEVSQRAATTHEREHEDVEEHRAVLADRQH